MYVVVVNGNMGETGGAYDSAGSSKALEVEVSDRGHSNERGRDYEQVGIGAV